MVDSDEAQVYLKVTSAFEGAPPLPGSSSAAFHTHVTMQSSASRPDRWMYVFPLGGPQGATVSLPCAAAAPSDVAQVVERPYLNGGRAAQVARTADGLHASPCPEGGEVVVRGDLVVSLWEWDAELRSDQGASSVETGQLRQNAASDAPDTRPLVGSARQSFLMAQNATLVLREFHGVPTDVYVGAMGFQGVPELRLQDGSGQVGVDGAPLEGKAVVLKGDLQAIATSVPGPAGQPRVLLLRVHDGLREADADGKVRYVHPESASATVVGVPGWAKPALLALLAGALAALATGLAVLYLRGRKIVAGGGLRATLAAGHVLSADFRLESGRPRGALWHARMAMAWAPPSPEALEVRLEALKQLGRFDEALAGHEAFALLAKEDDFLLVQNAIEAAATCCRAGHAARAVVWLRSVGDANPAALASDLSRPEFELLADDPWFRRVRQAAAPADMSYI
jgi:hypothetical protein